MAFTFTTLTKGGSDTDAISYTTASITPSADKTILASILIMDLAGNFQTPVVTGNGLTWTLIGAQGFGTPTWQAYYRASSYNAPSTGAVTFTPTVTAGNTSTGAAWIIFEIGGSDIFTQDGIVQGQGFDANNRTANDTLTLTALNTFASANNLAVGIWGAYDNAGGALAFTAGTGFTVRDSVSQTAGGDTLLIGYETAVNDTTIDISVSAANDRLQGGGLEIADFADRPKRLSLLGVGP